jgi:carboxyl-terminal processing protease
MRASTLSAFRLGWLLVLWALALPTAYSQTVTLAQPLAVNDDLASVLEKGARLERERNWAEALSHYEAALRQHPHRPELQKLATLARAHYDVCRRYNDQTYVSAVRSLSERDALAVYDEVLFKIHTHYVHQPDWPRLLECGLASMTVAVSEPLFVEKQLPSVPVEQLSALQKDAIAMVSGRAATDRRQALELVQSVALTLRDRYHISAAAVFFEFTSGAAAALDDYSGFLTGTQMDEVFSQIEGNFVGLGVELKTEPAGLLIINVIPGGPAHGGGIRTGDRIVAVANKTTADASPDTLADLLRGQEGSQVDVVVRDAQDAVRNLRLVRRRVEIPSVERVQIVDPQYGIGYFKLTSFQKTTSRDVDAALWKLHEQGMRQLIIDLRGNPGGLLKAAVEVADKFLYDGLIVATRGRSPREDFDHRGEVAGTWRVPLVLLIDDNSASASEILAGAIRDHRRGTVVGQKSYGKGSVQGIFPLAIANLGVRLTTAKWYTPTGQAIQGAGIAPDIAVQVANKPVVANKPADSQLAVNSNDSILEAGLQVARSQLSSRRTAPQQASNLTQN